MLNIKNLNKEIVTLEGIGIADFRGKKHITYKSALVATCEMHRPKEPGSGEALKSFDLGVRIQKSNEEISLEKEEIEFLKKIVDESGVYIAVIIGRLIHFLDETLKTKAEESNNNQK